MEKLIKIQNELKAPKNQFNKFGNYKYRSCEDILEALKPLLFANNCTLTITDEVKTISTYMYLEATASLYDDEKNISISCRASAGIDVNQKGMSIAQCFGSSSSYARKYALNGLFLIDDTKDDDFLNTHDKQPAKFVSPSNEVNSQKQDVSNEKAWLSDKACSSAVERILKGEIQLQDKILNEFKVRQEYQKRLSAAVDHYNNSNN